MPTIRGKAGFRCIFSSSTLIASIALMGLAGNAHANQLDDVRARGKLVCGTMDTNEPMGFLDRKTNQVVGFDVDVCAAVAKGLGVGFEQRSLSLDQRIPELQIGRVDILSAILGYTRERAQQIDFSDSHFQIPIKVLVSSESPFKKVADLDGHKVGAVGTGTTEYWMRRKYPGVTVVTFRDSPTTFLAMQQGKTEGYVVTVTSGSRYLTAAGKGKYHFTEDSLAWEPNGLGMRKNEPEFLAAVNGVLTKMEQNGELEKIWNRWLGPDTDYKLIRDKKLTPIAQVAAEVP